MPLPTLLLSYGFYALVGALVFGTGLSKMTAYTMIPDEALLLTVLIIVGVAIGTFLVLYLVAFQEKKTKVLELKKKALEAGTVVDEIELARVENFHNIYIVAMLLGAALTAAAGYVAMVIAMPSLVELEGPCDYYLWSAIVTCVAGLFLDRYFCHPIADGQFKTKVINPLLDEFINKFQTSTDGTGASALTDEQKQKFLDFISKL